MNTENTYLTKLTTKGCFTADMTSHSSTGVPNNINNGPVHCILRSHSIKSVTMSQHAKQQSPHSQSTWLRVAPRNEIPSVNMFSKD